MYLIRVLNILFNLFKFELAHFMNSSQESPLTLAVHKAVYSDIVHIAKLFDCTSTFDECLPIMHPDNLYQIVINAEQRLSGICFQCIEEIYKEYCSGSQNHIPSSLRPSFRMISEIKNILSVNTNILQKEISQYEYRYELLVNSMNRHEAQCNDTAYTGALVGAALFGSWGAVFGNIAGGAMAKQSALEDLSERSQKLISHFLELLRNINIFLAQMESNTFQLITGYAESLHSHLKQSN
jgi:hypothetical protein